MLKFSNNVMVLLMFCLLKVNYLDVIIKIYIMKNVKRLLDGRCKKNKYDIIKYLKSRNFLAQKSSKVLFKFIRFAKILQKKQIGVGGVGSRKSGKKFKLLDVLYIGAFLRKRVWVWVHQSAVSKDNLHKILKLLFRFLFSEKLFSCENIVLSSI